MAIARRIPRHFFHISRCDDIEVDLRFSTNVNPNLCPTYEYVQELNATTPQEPFFGNGFLVHNVIRLCIRPIF